MTLTLRICLGPHFLSIPCPLLPIQQQAALEEPERTYLLAKARAMVDGVRVITRCPAAARAGTAKEAKQRRVEAAPLSLRGRVEREEALPKVEVRWVQNLRAQETLRRAVLRHVVTNLKADLVVELLQAIRPRWS